MRCQDIMKRDVECVSATDTVQLAARKMRDADVGFLPICDADRRVIGTLTDRDLAVRLLADGRDGSVAVSEVMTREVVSCRPEDDIAEAQRLMGARHVSRIVCIDTAGRLAGVISLSDLAQVQAAAAAETLREVSAREFHPAH